MDPSPRAGPKVEDLRRRMSVGIRCTYRNHRDFGPGRGYELRYRAVPAPVMRNLGHLHSGEGLSRQPVADLAHFRVAHQESAKLAVLNDEADRGVVLISARWRGKHADLRGTKGDGPAGRSQILRSAALHGGDGSLINAGSVRKRVVEVVTNRGAAQYGWHSTDVIGVIVRRHEQVDRVDLERRQIRHDPRRRRSRIHERGLAALANQDRVALPDVEESQLELLGA